MLRLKRRLLLGQFYQADADVNVLVPIPTLPDFRRMISAPVPFSTRSPARLYKKAPVLLNKATSQQ